MYPPAAMIFTRVYLNGNTNKLTPQEKNGGWAVYNPILDNIFTIEKQTLFY